MRILWCFLYTFFSLFQSWKVTAIRLEEKKRFISMFCKAVSVYQPNIYREILLKNLPDGIELAGSTAETLENAISMRFILINEITFNTSRACSCFIAQTCILR